MSYFHDFLTRVFGEHVIVVGGLGPIGLAAVGAGDPVGEGVGPHVPLQQRTQRESAPTQLALKQQSIFSSVAETVPGSGAFFTLGSGIRDG